MRLHLGDDDGLDVFDEGDKEMVGDWILEQSAGFDEGPLRTQDPRVSQTMRRSVLRDWCNSCHHETWLLVRMFRGFLI